MQLRVSIGVLWSEAFRAMVRHRSRSALSAIGITIGIAAVVWVVAIGRGGAARTQELLRNLGDNLIWVEAGSRNINGVRNGNRGTTTLTVADAEAIGTQIPAVKGVSPQIDGTVLLVHGNRTWTTRYRGVAPEYLEIKRWPVAQGASFSRADVDQAATVCILGKTVADRLFDGVEPVGQLVRIGAQLFEVAGVLSMKGQSAYGQDQDDVILLPFTTAMKRIRGVGPDWVDDVLCSGVSPGAVTTASEQIVALLRERHRLSGDDENDFNLRRPEEALKAQLEAAETFAVLLICMASVALLVGGIGVMNVMLASVMERTREIGVRLAVGATPSDVQIQFLAESVMLCVLGGTLGIVLSGVGTAGLEMVVGWPVSIPPDAVLIALTFSSLVGLAFGIYPARLASRLDPIEALRRE